jgi:hypothetical protein
MRDDLEDMIFKTSVLMGLHQLRRPGDRSLLTPAIDIGFEESMKNIHIARFDATPKHDPFLWYLDFRAKWEGLMEFLTRDEALAKDIQSAF